MHSLKADMISFIPYSPASSIHAFLSKLSESNRTPSISKIIVFISVFIICITVLPYWYFSSSVSSFTLCAQRSSKALFYHKPGTVSMFFLGDL